MQMLAAMMALVVFWPNGITRTLLFSSVGILLYWLFRAPLERLASTAIALIEVAGAGLGLALASPLALEALSARPAVIAVIIVAQAVLILGVLLPGCRREHEGAAQHGGAGGY
jgi:hypothetical protein